MAKHANIPHEIVWNLRRKMECARKIVKELEEALKGLGKDADPEQVTQKVSPILRKLADMRPELDMLVNFIERTVQGYIGGRSAGENTITFEWVLEDLDRYDRHLADVIERLADFKEGRLAD